MESTFRVASVSKMVTAAGFMRLVEEQGVDLDADVSRYLSAQLRHPRFPNAPITSRRLLSHTSGLRNGASFPVPFNVDLLGWLEDAREEPDHGGYFGAERPGDFFAYSDLNYGVVAQVIEQVSGQRFDLYMRDALFVPLGLDCGYNWSGVSQAARDRAAPGVRHRDGVWVGEVDAPPPEYPEVALYRGGANDETRLEAYRVGQNGLAFSPHGGLRLSLRNMDALAQFFAHGEERILSSRAARRMQRPVWIHDGRDNGQTDNGFFASFGLGVQLPGRNARDAFAAIPGGWRGHFGDAYGWITGLIWNARTRETIVYAINGMPETNRPQGATSALYRPEEQLIAVALAGLATND